MENTAVEEDLGNILGGKPTYKELAKYLGVSEQAVKQYPPKKRELMRLGYWVKRAIEEQKGDRS